MLQHLGCRKGNAGPQHVSERGGWRFVQSNTNARHVCVAQISTGPSSSNPINVDLKIQQTQLPRHSDAGSQSQQRSSQSYYRKTASKPSAVFSPSSASTPEELVMKLQQRIRSVTSDQPLFLQTMLFSEVGRLVRLGINQGEVHALLQQLTPDVAAAMAQVVEVLSKPHLGPGPHPSVRLKRTTPLTIVSPLYTCASVQFWHAGLVDACLDALEGDNAYLLRTHVLHPHAAQAWGNLAFILKAAADASATPGSSSSAVAASLVKRMCKPGGVFQMAMQLYSQQRVKHNARSQPAKIEPVAGPGAATHHAPEIADSAPQQQPRQQRQQSSAAEHAQPQALMLTPQGLCNILLACGCAPVKPPEELLHGLVADLVQYVAMLNAQDVSNALYSMGQLAQQRGYQPKEAHLKALRWRASELLSEDPDYQQMFGSHGGVEQTEDEEARIEEAQAREYAEAVDGGAAGSGGMVSTMPAPGRATHPAAMRFTAQGLSNSLLGLAYMGSVTGKALAVKRLARTAQARSFRKFSAQDTSNICWALSKIGYVEPAFYEALCRAAVHPRYGTLVLSAHSVPQTWCNVMLALAQVQYLNEAVMAAAERAILGPRGDGTDGLLPRFNEQDCANTLWAVAYLLHLPNERFLALLLTRLCTQLKTAPLQALTNSLWALAALEKLEAHCKEALLILQALQSRHEPDMVSSNLQQLWQMHVEAERHSLTDLLLTGRLYERVRAQPVEYTEVTISAGRSVFEVQVEDALLALAGRLDASRGIGKPGKHGNSSTGSRSISSSGGANAGIVSGEVAEPFSSSSSSRSDSSDPICQTGDSSSSGGTTHTIPLSSFIRSVTLAPTQRLLRQTPELCLPAAQATHPHLHVPKEWLMPLDIVLEVVYEDPSGAAASAISEQGSSSQDMLPAAESFPSSPSGSTSQPDHDLAPDASNVGMLPQAPASSSRSSSSSSSRPLYVALVAVECDGPSHFLISDPSRVDGPTQQRNRWLRHAFGGRLMTVPVADWAELSPKGQGSVEPYLLAKLQNAVLACPIHVPCVGPQDAPACSSDHSIREHPDAAAVGASKAAAAGMSDALVPPSTQLNQHAMPTRDGAKRQSRSQLRSSSPSLSRSGARSQSLPRSYFWPQSETLSERHECSYDRRNGLYGKVSRTESEAEVMQDSRAEGASSSESFTRAGVSSSSSGRGRGWGRGDQGRGGRSSFTGRGRSRSGRSGSSMHNAPADPVGANSHVSVGAAASQRSSWQPAPGSSSDAPWREPSSGDSREQSTDGQPATGSAIGSDSGSATDGNSVTESVSGTTAVWNSDTAAAWKGRRGHRASSSSSDAGRGRNFTSSGRRRRGPGHGRGHGATGVHSCRSSMETQDLANDAAATGHVADLVIRGGEPQGSATLPDTPVSSPRPATSPAWLDGDRDGAAGVGHKRRRVVVDSVHSPQLPPASSTAIG